MFLVLRDLAPCKKEGVGGHTIIIGLKYFEISNEWTQWTTSEYKNANYILQFYLIWARFQKKQVHLSS